jgi:TP901 family phage tail tape measure protein
MSDKNYSIHISVKAVSNFDKIAKKLDANLNKIDKSLKKINTTNKATTATFKSMETAMTRLSFVAIPAFGLAIRSIWKEGTRYEESVKDLSALTGIQGERLDELTNKADHLALRWGLDAKNIVTGMKRIASNKSEFIEVEGAIERVAEASALLARASGLTFFKSGETITATMNQFKLGLGDTERIVHMFAEAAKLGSFEVDRLSQVFGRAGGAMTSIGADLGDTMAIAMIGSRLGLTGEMVGTQMKTGMLRLAQKKDIFNPAIVGFENALDNISKAGLEPDQLMSIFGLESFQVAEAFSSNIKLFKKWKKEITGTNTAWQQASTNMGAVNRRIDKVSQRFKIIQRQWFFDERTQKAIHTGLDRLEEFLTQSTWQARLLKHALKGIGTALIVSLAVFGTAKFIKGATLLYKFATATKVIAVANSIDKFVLGIMGITRAAPLALSGIAAILAKVAVVGAFIVSIGTEVWESFKMAGDSISAYWEDKDWGAVGLAVGKALGYGLWKGLLKFAILIAKPFAALEEMIGDILMGKDYVPVIRPFFDDALQNVNDLQQQGLNKDTIARNLRKQFYLDNPAAQQQVENGEVKLHVTFDENGVPTAIVQEKKGPVEVDTGSTQIQTFTANPYGSYGFAF